MAYRITSPHYSFVNFNHQHLQAEWIDYASPWHNIGFCLPYQDPNDIAFQIIIEGDTDNEGDVICSKDLDSIELGLYKSAPINSISNNDFTQLPLRVDFATLGAVKHRLNSRQVLYYIPALPDNFNSFLEYDQCFQLAVRITIISNFLFNINARAVSNCFRLAYGDHYTSLLSYSSDMDDASFHYCIAPNMVNKIRLPMYTSKILYTEEHNVYRQSDGKLTLLKAEIGKAYEIQTDYMPEWAHDCLQAALVNDTKNIGSAKYFGDFQKSGNYELDHQKFLDYPLIPAKFKIDASPVIIKNNNSGECGAPQGQISTSAPYVHEFVSCKSYTIPFEELGLHVCCAPFTAYFEYYNLAVDPTDSITIVGETLVINYKGPNPGIPMNELTGLGRIHITCPNGEHKAMGVNCIRVGTGSC